MQGGCRWSHVSGALQPGERLDKLSQAGILLFRNLFELDPALEALFPFKNQEGKAKDDVSPHPPSLPSLIQRIQAGLRHKPLEASHSRPLGQSLHEPQALRYSVQPAV